MTDYFSVAFPLIDLYLKGINKGTNDLCKAHLEDAICVIANICGHTYSSAMILMSLEGFHKELKGLIELVKQLEVRLIEREDRLTKFILAHTVDSASKKAKEVRQVLQLASWQRGNKKDPKIVRNALANEDWQQLFVTSSTVGKELDKCVIALTTFEEQIIPEIRKIYEDTPLNVVEGSRRKVYDMLNVLSKFADILTAKCESNWKHLRKSQTEYFTPDSWPTTSKSSLKKAQKKMNVKLERMIDDSGIWA